MTSLRSAPRPCHSAQLDRWNQQDEGAQRLYWEVGAWPTQGPTHPYMVGSLLAILGQRGGRRGGARGAHVGVA